MIRQKEVCELIGRDRTTLYRWRRNGKFPKPIEDPGGELMWRTSVIENWLTELEEKSKRW
tara:strand:- start:107 stop:286 length:180 start_codon:yes stop_codon:yes gene_type:complete